MRPISTKYMVTEGVSGMWHYHISKGDATRSLCRKLTMKSNLKLEDWKVPFGAHMPKKPTFCEHCDAMWFRHDEPKMAKVLEDSGVLFPRMVDGHIIGLHSYFSTFGLIIGVQDITFMERRYCYAQFGEAMKALKAFNNVDEHASGPWIKCKGVYQGAMIDAYNPSFIHSTS